MALYGLNDIVISDVTIEGCMKRCDEETTFACISIDYTTLGTCFLSSHSHVTDSDMYGRHDGSTYAYATSCVESEEQVSSEENEISEEGSEEGEQPNQGKITTPYYQLHHSHSLTRVR